VYIGGFDDIFDIYLSEEANNLSTSVLGFFCGSVDCFTAFVESDGA
jgi:hypothetical protein